MAEMDFKLADVPVESHFTNAEPQRLCRDGFLSISFGRKGAANGYDWAMKHFNKAIEIDPQMAEAYYGKGTVFIHLKQYDQAIEELDKALAIRRDYPEACQNKGYALHMLGRQDEAVKCMSNKIQAERKIRSKKKKRGHYIDWYMVGRACLVFITVAFVLGCAVLIWISPHENEIPLVKQAGNFSGLNDEERLFKSGSVVRVQKGDAEIAMEDMLYREGDVIRLDVTLGLDTFSGTKYRISQVVVQSPVKKVLYNNPNAGFGGVVVFSKNLNTLGVYGESDTENVDFSLDGRVVSEEKQTIEFMISYVAATALYGGGFVESSGAEIVSVDVYPVERDGVKGYLLRDPKYPRNINISRSNRWNVAIDLVSAETWDELVSWSPIHIPERNIIMYAGMRDGRCDYVLDYGLERETSFGGPGYDAFGEEEPVFDQEDRAIFYAQRDGKWCLVFGGTELPFHENIIKSSTQILEDGRVAYVALDEGVWSVLIASPQGCEFSIFSQNIKSGVLKGHQTIALNSPSFQSDRNRFYFVVDGKSEPETDFIFYSKQRATDVNEETVSQDIIIGPSYYSIAEWWLSEKDELVYIAQKTKEDEYKIYIDNQEWPFDEAREYLLSLFDKYVDEQGNNFRKDAMESKLNSYKHEFKIN